MYKILLSASLLLLSFNSAAQVTSSLLTCNPPAGYGFPFTVKFDGTTVITTFRGVTYNLFYFGSKVDFEGKRWSEYLNAEIKVSTTFPLNNWVSIFIPSQERAIAGDNCK